MPSHKRCWILVKGTECNPDRILSLGQMLSDPFQPSFPLLPEGPSPVPEHMIERSYQEDVDHSSLSCLGTSFDVWASASGFPVQGNIGGHRQVESAVSWHLARLEGQIFAPSVNYVTEALESKTAKDQIKSLRFNFRKRLYMVVGVRIARGARKSNQASQFFGGRAGIGVDATMLGGLPLATGVGGNHDRFTARTESFQGASDFVYAYRLLEIYYGKRISFRPYAGGETYGVGDGSQWEDVDMDGAESMEEEVQLIVEGVSSHDFNGDGRLQQLQMIRPSSKKLDEEYYILE